MCIRDRIGVLFILDGTLCAQGGKAFLKEGDAFRAQNELSKAIERYDLAIDVDPKYIKAYLARAEVYQQMGRVVEGAADLRKASDLDPGEADLAVRAAQGYMTCLLYTSPIPRDRTRSRMQTSA